MNYSTIMTNVSKISIFLSILSLLNFASCQELDGINDRLDKLETSVSDTQSAIKALQEAYNQGKTIKSVTPLTDAEAGGWLIVFSDNSEIRIVNGKNGVDGKDGQNCQIASISKNEKTHNITITLLDGSVFTFNMHVVTPTSIAILSVNPIYLTDRTQASLEFRVNPSNAVFSYSEDSCQIVLDKVGIVQNQNQTRSSYVTNPTNYKLVRIEQVFDNVTNEIKEGQYRAIIEDDVKSAEYDELTTLVLNTNDANGDPIQISSSAFRVIGKNIDNLVKTGLPIIVINTPNSTPIESKDTYVTGSMITIINSDMTFDLQDEMKMKGRGNSTWQQAKKPYKIKFDKKQSVLGEAKDKEWVLIANYSDKTMMRNALAYYMGHKSTLDYTTSYHFVELILNGAHQGTYMLAEQQKISKGRVNVGNDGFLVEVDARARQEEVIFNTAHMGNPFNIKDPDLAAGDENFNYVYNYFTAADEALYSSNFTDPQEGYNKYIDTDSFVEWYLINEIARNNDSKMYASCYMNLARGGKIKMGPLWDMDTAFGNINYNDNWQTEGFYIKSAHWIGRMFKDPAFVQKVKTRMTYYYDNKQLWLDQIDYMAKYLDNSQSVNEDIWHTMKLHIWPNYKVWGSYNAEVEYLKKWLSDRIDWLQTNIQAL